MKRITKIEAVKTQSNKKLRVAAYARVSTSSDEQLLSLEAQKRHYELYIKARPDWEYAGMYYDEGVTGTKMAKRDGLLRLLDDCEKGLIDYIIVKSISRFSRNTVESIETIRKLSQAGIYIFFEKENIDTGRMESELLLSILSSLAESESRSISENSKWSIQKRFANGTFKLGYMPFGYKNVDGKMVIDESEAEHVRWIFEAMISGLSTMEIAKELNARNVPTKKGKPWSGHTINSMIKNEKYVGDVIFGKTYTDSQFNRHKNTGERDKYHIENHHEPIVSRETFEAANRILRFNRIEKNIQPESGKYYRRYALSGMIVCGECGGKWKRQQRYAEAWYVCSTHIDNKDVCSQMAVRESSIQAAFLTVMNKLTFARKQVLIPLSGALTSTGNEKDLEKLTKIQEDLEKLVSRKQSVESFFSKGFLDPAVYEEELDVIKAEEGKLTRQRGLLTQNVSTDYDKNKALTALLRFTAKGEILSEFDENLLTEHVKQIVMYSRTEIGFVMKCGPTFRERMEEI